MNPKNRVFVRCDVCTKTKCRKRGTFPYYLTPGCVVREADVETYTGVRRVQMASASADDGGAGRVDAASHEFPEDLEAGNDAEKTEKENRKRGEGMKRIDTLKTREDFIRAAEAECGHGSKEVNCSHGCVFCNMSSEGGSYCQDIWECMANWLYAEVKEAK